MTWLTFTSLDVGRERASIYFYFYSALRADKRKQEPDLGVLFASSLTTDLINRFHFRKTEAVSYPSSKALRQLWHNHACDLRGAATREFLPHGSDLLQKHALFVSAKFQEQC